MRLAAILLLLTIAHFASSNQRQAYSFPKQPLTSSLLEVAKLNNLVVVYQSQLVENVQAPAVCGHYRLNETLELLLFGSNLRAKVTNGEVLTIIPGKVPPASPQVNMEIQELRVPADLNQGNRATEYVTVTGSSIPRPSFNLSYPTKIMTPQKPCYGVSEYLLLRVSA